MIELLNGKYQYSKNKMIGNGSFGHLYECYKKDSQEVFVIKIIKKSLIHSLGDYADKMI